jgi:hypothetical protein
MCGYGKKHCLVRLRLCDGRAFINKKMKMSTQVDLFTDVEPTSVSPAIVKPFVSRSGG